MLGIGLLELIFVVVVIGGFVALIARGFRLPRLGHATLPCPHCGKETKLLDGKCQHCGRDL